MHKLLQQYLEKQGVKRISDLDENERVTFDGWSSILSEGKVDVNKIKELCESQIGMIEGMWGNVENSTQKNERFIISHTLFKKIINLIDATQDERESLEAHLTSFIHNE